jgi:hypothetical protein
MSVQPVNRSQQSAQGEAVSQAQAQAQAAQKHASQQTAVPQDKVTISKAAQAKQTASAIGADADHDGK